MDWILSGSSTPAQSEPGSTDYKVLLYISQRTWTGSSLSDCLVLYFGHSLWGLKPLQKCSLLILQPHPTKWNMHCWHGFPGLFLSIRPNHPSLPAGLPYYILCPHRAVVSKFLLVGQHLYFHVKGFIRERHLWFRPCFSSSVPHVLFVLFAWF